MRSIAPIVLLALLAQACATMMYGTRQSIALNSTPSDATATIDGMLKETTPAVVSLSRDKDHVVAVEKEGYVGATASINRSFNGWSTILGNILWLLPGVVVDLWAGGAWTLEASRIDVTLTAKKS